MLMQMKGLPELLNFINLQFCRTTRIISQRIRLFIDCTTNIVLYIVKFQEYKDCTIIQVQV